MSDNTPPTLPSVPGWALEPAPKPDGTQSDPQNVVSEGSKDATKPQDHVGAEGHGDSPQKAPERAPDGKFKAKDAPDDADETDPPEADGDPDEPEAKPGGKLEPGVVKRIARAKRQTERAAAERDEMGDSLDALRALIAEARETKALREPEPGDFATSAEFAKAHDRWTRVADAIGAQPAPRPSAADAEFGDAIAELREVVDASDKKLWQAVIDAGEGLKISQPMVLALNDADDPAAALRMLKDNPAEAERIAGLSPARQMAAILAIKPPSKAAPGKRVTQADDPPGGTVPRSAPVRDLNKMGFSEFEKSRSEDVGKSRFGW